MKFAAKNHRFGEKTAAFAKKLATSLRNTKIDENFEIRERCKGVHCVDLGESFPTSIFLQNLVSIQLKTSPETSKFDFRITQRFNFPMVFSPTGAEPVGASGAGTRRRALRGPAGAAGVQRGGLRPALRARPAVVRVV